MPGKSTTQTRKKITSGRSYARVLALAFLAVLLSVCSAPFAADVGEQTATLALEIRVSSPFSAQTILPDVSTEISAFRVSGDGPAGESFSVDLDAENSSVERSDVRPGEWSITVDALNAADRVILSGSRTVTVVPAQRTRAAIDLAPTVGTGSFSFSLSWTPSGYANPTVTASRERLPGGPSEAVPFVVDAETGTAVSETDDWDAGYYSFSIQLIDSGTTVWGRSYAVRILAGETTSGSAHELEYRYRLTGTWYSRDPTDAFALFTGEPPFDDAASPAEPPEFVEPGYPNDPLFADQWSLHELDMPAVWSSVTGSSSVVVAVLDTGIDETLSDFAGASLLPGRFFWENGEGEIESNEDTSDPIGHGTHVAGVIAQSAGNGIGTAGMAYGVTILPVRVIDDAYESSSDIIAAGIAWAVENGADIINMSIGDPNATPPDGMELLHAAIQDAVASGVTVIAAAGNNFGGSVRYPAAFEEVIAVAATDASGVLAPYSNYGPEIDVVAPGDAILAQTAQMMSFGPSQEPHPSDESFWYYSGTSQAAPHVSALAALIKSAKPDASPAEIRSAIVSTAVPIDPPEQYGAGMIDPVAALSFGANAYHAITGNAVRYAESGLDPEIWRVYADAGVISVTLESELTGVAPGIRLYDASGRFVAVSHEVAGLVTLEHDVKLAGGEYFIVVRHVP